MEFKIYTGEEARQKVHYLLEDVIPRESRYQLKLPEDRCLGYFRDEKRWVAFDNRGGNCWVEEFRTERKCLRYLGIKKP